MRKYLIFTTILVSLIVAACSTNNKALIKEFEKDQSVSRLLLVHYIGGSDADVEYLVREGDKLVTVETGKALVGKNGIGKEREGDVKTPVGTFSVTGAFGIRENPGTLLKYTQITPSIFACDEDCEYYNTIIDTTGTGHLCHGEHMIDYTDEYAYGFTINYNPDNIYPKGSSIFIHCKGRKPYTFGCIALDSAFIVKMMTGSDTGFRVHLH